jgi:Leucine-rich repeat (LRR) protein
MIDLISFTAAFKDLSAKNALAPLRSLTELENLVLTRSQITVVSGLETLSKLATVDLSGNNISDLSPLLQNMALGANTTLNVSGNPITCEDASVAALMARKVKVQPCVP